MSKIIKLLILSTLSLIISCGQNGIIETSDNSQTVAGLSQWRQDQFPLNIKISDAFSQQERKSMGEVGQSWSRAHGGIVFFDFGETSEIPISMLTDYDDNIFGIYKMKEKAPDYVNRALAITQVFSNKINYNGKVSYVMRHADIVVNYADFSFSSDSSYGSYDLNTVILHELGHFIGLNHFESETEPSIMEPSIDSFDLIHEVFPVDREIIKKNYPQKKEREESLALRSLASIAPASIITGEESVRHDQQEKAPTAENISVESVRIIHMLKPDHSCEHYIDGKLVHKHQLRVSSKK